MNKDNIIISSIHFHINDGHKHHIHNKCEKLFKHQKRIEFLQLELEKDLHSKSHSKEYIAKGRMGLKGKITCLSASSDNMFESIDLLVDKFNRSLRKESRIRKFKRKIISCLTK